MIRTGILREGIMRSRKAEIYINVPEQDCYHLAPVFSCLMSFGERASDALMHTFSKQRERVFLQQGVDFTDRSCIIVS